MFKVITPIATEPVSSTEAKLHLRVTDTAEDSLITNLITAAREYCEQITGRGLASQTLELMLDSFPAGAIEMPMPPLQSVTSIKYTDSDETETTVDSDDYVVDTDSVVGKVMPAYGKSWPSFTPYPVNAVRIRFVAGYTSVPKSIKQAILLLVGHWYANRETTITGTVSQEIEFTVKALLSQYRVRWLG